MNHKIAGPYKRFGEYYIQGKNDLIVLTIDPLDQHGEAERNALISDLIDFLTQRDKERAAGQSWNPGEYLKRRSR